MNHNEYMRTGREEVENSTKEYMTTDLEIGTYKLSYDIKVDSSSSIELTPTIRRGEVIIDNVVVTKVEQKVTPEMRKLFLDNEGCMDYDPVILEWYNRKEPVEEPELTYADHLEAQEKQVGGSHYVDMVITPTEYIVANDINWCEANVIKYISRHGSKNGREDVEKAKHYCELILKGYDEDERREANLS